MSEYASMTERGGFIHAPKIKSECGCGCRLSMPLPTPMQVQMPRPMQMPGGGGGGGWHKASVSDCLPCPGGLNSGDATEESVGRVRKKANVACFFFGVNRVPFFFWMRVA